MINIAVCDDEKYIAEKIKKMIEDFFKKKNTDISIAVYFAGEELLKRHERTDIIFLDIGMREMDGIETAKRLRAKGFQGFLVFITVLKEMVFQSFEAEPFDYLVKPVREEHFEKTMERLFCSLQVKLSPEKGNLLVQKGCESYIISFQDMVCCEIIDRKVFLYLCSGEVISYYDRIFAKESKTFMQYMVCGLWDDHSGDFSHAGYSGVPCIYATSYGGGKIALQGGFRFRGFICRRNS